MQVVYRADFQRECDADAAMGDDEVTWTALFLERRSLAAPDPSRPLWSYRCTAEEFRAAVIALEPLRRGTPPTQDRDLAQVFAVAAAEAIRRGYDGGSWSWKVVRNELRVPLDDGKLRDLARLGLARWHRPLRQGVEGTRYLQSLLAEGGLPVRLLRQEGGSLRTIGSAILRDLQALSMGSGASEEDLEVVAARCAAPHARVGYLAEPSIHALLGTLLQGVRLAVMRVPPEYAADPAGWLAAHAPDWLNSLPLDLSAEEAVSLVRSLVVEASAIQSEGGTARIQTFLDLREPASLTRALALPALWHTDRFREFFGIPSAKMLPRRLAVHLVGERVVEAAHLLLRADGAHFETRLLGQRLWIAGPVRVELVGGFDDALVAPSAFGDRLPNELPWVFAPAADHQWRLVGFGAVSHPAQRVLVAVPGEPSADQRVAARLPGGRVVVEVNAPTQIQAGEEWFTVRPGGPLSEEGELRFTGARHPYSQPGMDVWVGLPRPLLLLPSGATRVLSPDDLEVRRPAGSWAPWGTHSAGRVDVRCRRSPCRETLLVAPADLTVEVKAGSEGGTVLAQGADVSDLGITTPRLGFVAQRLGLPSGCAQSVSALSEPPMELDVEVMLRSGTRIPLRVPFPRKFSGFQDSRTSAPAWPMGIDDLPWLRAVRLGDSRASAALVGRLAVGGNRVPSQEFTLPLVSSDAGGYVHQLALRSVRHRIEDLLSQESGPEAEVLLEVTVLGSTARADCQRLRRYRYELFVADEVAHILSLRPTDDDTEEIIVEGLRLDDSAPARVLPRLRPGTRWMATDLPEGVWMFAARRYGAVVAQPVWATCETAGAPVFHQRADQLAGADGTSGDAALDAQLVLLAGGVRAAHLPAVLAATAGPASAVRAASRALASANPTALTALVDGLETLPFLWEGIPLRDWEAVPEAAWEALAPVRLANASIARTLLLAQLGKIVEALPHLAHPFAWWFARRDEADPFAGTNDRVSVRNPALARVLLGPEVEAVRRRHAGKLWTPLDNGRSDMLALAKEELRLVPSGKLTSLVSAAHAHERPVLMAPLLAAQAAFDGVALPVPWVRRLRELRRFDPDWFSFAYRLCLAVVVGNHR